MKKIILHGFTIFFKNIKKKLYFASTMNLIASLLNLQIILASFNIKTKNKFST